jgi:hypothetical protein
MSRIRPRLLACCLALLWLPCVAQQVPTDVSISNLSLHPGKFDARLVRVRAFLIEGWEGDNFLIDPLKPRPKNMPSRNPPSIWLYDLTAVKAACGPQTVCLFTGRFHFVPDKKSRIQAAFDPGPLQLEAVSTSVWTP